ncbi:hypothetical protein OY671_010009, partial [Metschnikowia pulcherrima]
HAPAFGRIAGRPGRGVARGAPDVAHDQQGSGDRDRLSALPGRHRDPGGRRQAGRRTGAGADRQAHLAAGADRVGGAVRRVHAPADPQFRNRRARPDRGLVGGGGLSGQEFRRGRRWGDPRDSRWRRRDVPRGHVARERAGIPERARIHPDRRPGRAGPWRQRAGRRHR